MSDWWRGAVVYQVYPRSFKDSNVDGTGDLPGVVDGLPYVADLGVDAIWLSPFFTSPMHDSGYDVSDFCGVDPVFGSLDDFDRLLETAHGLGLKVIIDQVYSHSSREHPWFLESRASRTNDRADWYVWADPKPDGTPPNNWQSVFNGAAWTWDGHRQQYYLHNFLPQQPDLNLHNPDVQKAVLDIAQFWLDRGVDGFRLDAANFYMHDPLLRDNPPARPKKPGRTYDFQQHLYNRSRPENFNLVTRLRALIDSYQDRFTIAEIGDRNSEQELIDYVRGRDRFHSAYSFVFFEAESLTADLVRTSFEPWQPVAGEAWPSWAFSNHDVPRIVSRWAKDEAEEGDPRFAALLNVLLCSLRGTIFLYQGQELGLPQAKISYHQLKDPEAIANWPHTLGRDGARSPMPWQADAPNAGFSSGIPFLPVDAAQQRLAVDRQAGAANSPLEQLRRFLRLRRDLPVLRHGNITFLDTTDPILAFARERAGERLVCLFNLDRSATAWHNDGTFDPPPEPIGLSEGACLVGQAVELPAYGWAILKG